MKNASKRSIVLAKGGIMTKTTIKARKKALLKQLSKIVIEKISETELRVTSWGGTVMKKPGDLIITSQYNRDEFGFAPGDFVCYPNKKIAICIGVNIGPKEPYPLNNLWFLEENDRGATYWGANRKQNFIDQGFALVP